MTGTIRTALARVDESLACVNVGDSTDPNAPHFDAAISHLRDAVGQLADQVPAEPQRSPHVLEMVFTTGTLAVRGVTVIRYIDGILKHGRPFDFDSEGALLADPGQVKCVRLLTAAQAWDLGLNLPDDGSINWRSRGAAA